MSRASTNASRRSWAPSSRLSTTYSGKMRNGARSPTRFAGSARNECPVAQLGDRLLKFSLRVHYDRPVPSNRLFDRLAGDQQEADAVFPSLHRNFAAAVEQHQ